MKKHGFKIFILFFCFFLAGNSVFSQENSEKYKKIVFDAQDKLNRLAHKEILSIEQQSKNEVFVEKNGKLIPTDEIRESLTITKSITEFAPLGKKHTVVISETRIKQPKMTDCYSQDCLRDITTNSKEETISIGDDLFVKIIDKKWQKDKNKKDLSSKGEPIINVEKDFIGYSFKGIEEINGIKVNVYELLAKSTTNNSTILERYFIDSREGNLLKEEYEGNLFNNKVILKSVTTYEIDQNIKIETPQIEN